MFILLLSTLICWLASLHYAKRMRQQFGVGGALPNFLVSLVCAGLGTLCGILLMVVQSFHAFSAETLVARVTTRRLSSEWFILSYMPVDTKRSTSVVVQIRGDQWAITGGIVKWHHWLTAAGMKSYHKPMRISGQFADPKRHSRAPTTSLLEPDTDKLWEWFYWMHTYLPFVEAVYGSTASAYVESNVVFHVYASPYGYLITQ